MSSLTSSISGASSRLSKQQLFEELAWFMPALALSIELLYGTGAAALMRSPEMAPGSPDLYALQATPLWRALSELYDYGAQGVLPTINELGDGSLFDIELFLGGNGGLAEYLQEDDGGVPRIIFRTIELAWGRQLLDDGDPAYTLSVTQVAMLADADEDWLQRVAGLVVGGFVGVDDPLRWSAGCPGFAPTGCKAVPGFMFAKTLSVDLPVDVVRAIQERAGLAGMTTEEAFRTAFAVEVAGDERYASNVRRTVRSGAAGEPA